MALIAGTGLVNFQASAATYLSADLRQQQTELPGKPGRASAIYLNKIHRVSQIFAAILFVDDCGTKNPYQNSLSL